MGSKSFGILVGIGLIVLGFILFAGTFFRFEFEGEYVVAIFFGLAALFFLKLYIQNSGRWWSLVLTSICLIVTFAVFIENSRIIDDDYIGVAVNWIIGATFLTVFLQNRKHWWAIIPAGVFFTVGFVVFRESSSFFWFGEINSGFYMLLGLAITFGVLYYMTNEERNLSWAAYPALGFFGVTMIIGLSERYTFEGEYVVPILFIALGGFLLFKSTIRRKGNNNNQLEI